MGSRSCYPNCSKNPRRRIQILEKSYHQYRDWETCKGDAKSNIAYCCKQGNYQTFGEPNTRANSKETPSGHKED